jgi:hypothetical protein
MTYKAVVQLMAPIQNGSSHFIVLSLVAVGFILDKLTEPISEFGVALQGLQSLCREAASKWKEAQMSCVKWLNYPFKGESETNAGTTYISLLPVLWEIVSVSEVLPT